MRQTLTKHFIHSHRLGLFGKTLLQNVPFGSQLDLLYISPAKHHDILVPGLLFFVSKIPAELLQAIKKNSFPFSIQNFIARSYPVLITVHDTNKYSSVKSTALRQIPIMYFNSRYSAPRIPRGIYSSGKVKHTFQNKAMCGGNVRNLRQI